MKKRILAFICIIALLVYNTLIVYADVVTKLDYNELLMNEVTATDAIPNIDIESEIEQPINPDNLKDMSLDNVYDAELEAYVKNIVEHTDPDLILADPELDELKEMLYELKMCYPDYSYDQLKEMIDTIETEEDYYKLLGIEETESEEENFNLLRSVPSTSTGTVLTESLWDYGTCKFNCAMRRNGIDYSSSFGNILLNKSYIIPGLRTTNVAGSQCIHMIPQAICTAGGYILISAYCWKETHNSVLYVLNASNMQYVCTFRLDIKAHIGGMAYDPRSKYLWVCNSNNQSLCIYNLQNISTYVSNALATSSKTTDIKYFSAQKVAVTPSYCTYYDGMLWVGNFSQTSANTVIGYVVGGVSLSRKASIDAPFKTQGISFFKYNNQVYCTFTTSYGRKNDSYVYSYILSDYDKRMGSGILYKTIKKWICMPSMMEGILTSGYSVYTIFESAANKYRNGDGTGSSTNPCDRICKFTTGLIFK